MFSSGLTQFCEKIGITEQSIARAYSDQIAVGGLCTLRMPLIYGFTNGMSRIYIDLECFLDFRRTGSLSLKSLNEISELVSFSQLCDVNATCNICMETMQPEDLVRKCDCGTVYHTFHVQCIEKWLFQSTSCPTCRAEWSRDELRPQLRFIKSNFVYKPRNLDHLIHLIYNSGNLWNGWFERSSPCPLTVSKDEITDFDPPLQFRNRTALDIWKTTEDTRLPTEAEPQLQARVFPRLCSDCQKFARVGDWREKTWLCRACLGREPEIVKT